MPETTAVTRQSCKAQKHSGLMQLERFSASLPDLPSIPFHGVTVRNPRCPGDSLSYSVQWASRLELLTIKPTDGRSKSIGMLRLRVPGDNQQKICGLLIATLPSRTRDSIVQIATTGNSIYAAADLAFPGNCRYQGVLPQPPSGDVSRSLGQLLHLPLD